MADPMNVRATLGYSFRVVPGAVPLLLSVLAGCSGSNVQPGDPDYPQLNPNPRHWVVLHGTMDPTLNLQFSAGWVPEDPRTGWISKDPNCSYLVNRFEGATGPYSVRILLEAKRTGTTYSLRVPMDRFQPGRCNWQFTGIGFSPDFAAQSITLATFSGRPLPRGQSADEVLVLRCRWRPIGSRRLLFCSTSTPPPFAWLYSESRDLEVNFVVEGP